MNIIQGDAEVQTEMDEAMNWNARFNLYRSLQYDEELLFADDALQVFASEQDNGNIGKLYRAMTAYGNIELANEGAALDLQSVNPQNRPEQTLKEVLEVLTANDLSQLSDENESMLRDAALRCPIDDGFGVYIARSALLKIDTLPKNYVSDCELIPSPEQTSEKQQLDALSGFAVYPNPSVNTLFVEYNLKTEEQGEVRIHGIAGNLVWSKAIGSDTDRLEIDLAGISSGVYLLSIEVNGERKLSERVSVLRP